MATGGAQAGRQIIRFGEFELDLDRQTLSRRGIQLKLQNQPLQVLALLIQHAPRVVSRDEIQRHIWGENAYVDAQGGINFCIRQIRAVLLDDAAGSRFIETLPREGYRFVAPFEGAMQQEGVPSNDPALPKNESPAPFSKWPVPAIRKWRYWALAATLLATVIVIVVMASRTGNRPGRALISELTPPPDTTFNLEGGSPALSPDGHAVAFPASDAKGKIMLWVRSLDSFEARALAGTDGAQFPFWSPDSREIGFFAAGQLKTVDAAGSPPVALADAPDPGGGSWSGDGTIFFVADDSGRGISRVSVSGGPSLVISNAVDSSQFRICAVPQMLPDGRHLLFRCTGDRASAGTYFASTDGKEMRLLVNEESEALYASGYLLYRRGETLLARAFDPGRGLLTGSPHVLAEGLAAHPWARVFDVSQTGLLIYQKLGVAMSRIKLFGRGGQELGVTGEEGDYYDLRISPDSQKLAVNLSTPAGSLYSDIWIDDLTRRTRTKLTVDADSDHGVPVWSPDATEVAYGALEGKLPWGIYLRPSDGSGKNELLLAAGKTIDRIWPTSWSRDGRFILYTRGDIDVSHAALWILPLAGDRQPRLLLQSQRATYDGQFSPDGRWIAYTSEESGRREVYVVPFDPHGFLSTSTGAKASAGKFLISTDGGRAPRWRGDGTELFYLTEANQVMAAELDHAHDKLKVLSTQALFKTQIRLYAFAPFDVSANGDKFVINTLSERRTPFTLVQNWPARLSSR